MGLWERIRYQVLLGAMLVLLLVIAPVSWNYYDIRYFNEWYRVACEHGILSVYKYASKVAYPPIPIILYVSTYGLAEALFGDNIPLIRLIIKLPLIIAMLLITHIIYRLKGFKAASLWALCIAGYGIVFAYQFDLLIALALLASYYFIKHEKHLYAGLCFATAVLIKHVIALLAPVYLIYYYKRRDLAGLKSFIASALLFSLVVITPFFIYSPGDFIYKLLLFHVSRLPQGLSLYAIPLYIMKYNIAAIPKVINDLWFPVLIAVYILELYFLFYCCKEFSKKTLLYGLTLVAITVVLLIKVSNPQYYLWFAAFVPLVAVHNNTRDKLIALTYIVAPILSMALYPLVYVYSAAVVGKPVFVPEDNQYENATLSVINSVSDDPLNISTPLKKMLGTSQKTWIAIYSWSHIMLAVISIIYTFLLMLMAYKVWRYLGNGIL